MTDDEPKRTLGAEFVDRLRDALGIDEQGSLAGSIKDAQSLIEKIRVPVPELTRLELPEPDPDLLEQPANIRRLVEINNATNEQLIALATITGAALEESRLLRESLTAAARQQQRAAAWTVRLTWAIAILTALLAWQALQLWPF